MTGNEPPELSQYLTLCHGLTFTTVLFVLIGCHVSGVVVVVAAVVVMLC